MTTSLEAYRDEWPYMNKFPRRRDVWVHIKRWHVGHLEGWGEYSVKTTGAMIRASLREWESWAELSKHAFATVAEMVGESDRRIIVRQYDVDEII